MICCRYFLVLSTLCSYQVLAEPLIYALRGQAVTFTPNVKDIPDEILWKHNGNKMVEFDNQNQKVFDPYSGRVTLDWHSAEVEIKELNFTDSGEYILETIRNPDKSLGTFTYTLQVIDKVPQPTITCQLKESAKAATLTCAAEPHQSQSLLKFDWTSGGKHIQHQQGPNLTITLGGELDHEVYNCSVSNPLSEESAVFTANDCYPKSGVPLGLPIGIIACLLVLCILVFLLWKFKLKEYFSRRNEKDLEKQMPAANTEETNREEGRPLVDRVPTMPSNQTLHHLMHRNNTAKDDHHLNLVNELKQSFRHKPAGWQENGNEDAVTSPPPAVAAKPALHLRPSRKEREHKEEVNLGEKMEQNPPEPEKESEGLPVPLVNNGLQENGNKDAVTSSPSPPAVAAKPALHLRPSRKERGHQDEVNLWQNMEQNPSEPEKTEKGSRENENEDPVTSSPPPPVAAKPALPMPSSRKESVHQDEVNLGEEKEQNPSEPEKESDGLPGPLDNNESDKTSESDPEAQLNSQLDVLLPAASTQNSSNGPAEDGAVEHQESSGSDEDSREGTKRTSLKSDSVRPEEGRGAGSDVGDTELATSEPKQAEPEHEHHPGQQEPDAHVSEDDQEAADQEKRGESPLNTPQQPRRSEPDSSGDGSHPETPDAAQVVPDQDAEDKTGLASHSDSSTKATDKSGAGEENQLHPGDERMKNESGGEDKEEQKIPKAAE